MMESSLTLVMGARGGIGRLVLDRLLDQEMAVRASARQLEAGAFPADVEAVSADLTEPGSLRAAFDQVTQVFLFSVPEGVEQVVDAIGGAGVRRVVLLSSGSVLLPSCAENPITVDHREVEEAYETAAAELGFAFVPIRPLVLASNALGWAGQIAATDEISLYQPDALTAPIHEADIAAVAVAALTDSATGPAGSVSDVLTGPRRLSQRAQVAAIARARGRQITVREESRADAVARFSRFMPAEEAEAVATFLDDTAAGHSPATGTLVTVLGRPGAEFADWARDHADQF